MTPVHPSAHVEELGYVMSAIDAMTVSIGVQKMTVPTNANHLLLFNNSDSTVIWCGGLGVNQSNGIPIYPRTERFFRHIIGGFFLYVVTAQGTADLRTMAFGG